MATKTSKADDDIEAKLLQTATECQQHYYEISSDWNRYKKNEYDYLKDFIGYAMFGPPKFAESSSTDVDKKSQDFNHFVYEEKQKNAIDRVYQKIIKYGTNKDFDDVVLCGIIYIVIFNKKEAMKALKNANRRKNGKNKRTCEDDVIWRDAERTSEDNEMELRVYPVPLFKARGYKNEKIENNMNNGKADATDTIEYAYYIDNVGRVYYGFADYLANNTLPNCTMVVPKDGRYQGDPYLYINAHFAIRAPDIVKTNVWIDIHKSPASKAKAKVLQAGDIVTTAATVASMGVAIAAMVTPVGLGVAIAGAVGAGVGGVWTIGRSSQQLADRGQHRESINVTNKSALGAWIGIASGTMCLAASGGTALVARAIRTGATLSRAAMIAHDAVQIGNMIVNGIGFGFKSYDIYADYTERSGVLFLTAHTFFFCNFVINNRLAQSMIESTDGQLMKDFEISLRSKRHRKEGLQMTQNTNDKSNNEEIIRGINKIDTKDQFVQAMVRNQKDFSATNSKASIASVSKFSINGIMIIDPIEFSGLPREIRDELLPVTGKDAELSYKYFTSSSEKALKAFCAERSSEMMQSTPVEIGDFTYVLRDLRKIEDRNVIFSKLLVLGYKILQALPRYEAEIMLGDSFAFIVQFWWDYVKLNLKEMRPGMMIEEPSTQSLLNDLMGILIRSVQVNLDVWVKAFIPWVEIQFPQLINLRFFYCHKMQSLCDSGLENID